MAKKVVLKKYANRRLYDTEKSVYVTLQQLSDTIKSGRQVEVVDAQTGEDVTAFILAQIIVEEAKNKNALLPAPLLHLVIQYGETMLGEFFDKYLEMSIKNYILYRTSLDEQFRKWFDVGKDFSSFAQKTMPALTPWKPLFDVFSTQERKPEKDQTPSGKR